MTAERGLSVYLLGVPAAFFTAIAVGHPVMASCLLSLTSWAYPVYVIWS